MSTPRPEQALEESETRFQAVLDAVAEGIYVMGPDTLCTYLNPAGAAMLGYAVDELIGLGLHDIIHHSHPDRSPHPISQCPIAHAARDGVSAFIEDDVFWRKDGEPVHVSYTVSPILVEGAPAGAVVAYRDVTDKRRAIAEQASLLEQERKRADLLSRVAEAGQRITTLLTVEGIAELVAEEARTLIGAHQAVTSLTASPTMAQAINAVSLSEKYAAFRSYNAPTDGSGIYSEVCRSNRAIRLTQQELIAHPAWRGFGKEAATHPPMRGWLAVPLIGPGGRNLGLVQLSDKYEGDFTAADEAVLTQLAALAAAGLENARLYGELREEDKRKDEFLATLAHELRNPLAPVRTGLALLSRAASLEGTARVREMMERQIGHMVRLIDDLLDVSRITSGKVQLRRETLELQGVIDAALEASRPAIDSARHGLFLAVSKEPLYVDGDPTRLAQVIGNLLNNAAKYTPEGGRIELSAQQEGEHAVVRVRDNGVGIAPQMLLKVFDLFTQVGGSLDRAQGGLGIGLALVRKLVEMHGGVVEAQSTGTQGEGSTFMVKLPLVPAPVTTRIAGLPAAASVRAMNVLVVDDNVDAAETLAGLLALEGHAVRTAHSGPEALELIRAQAPELIFLDIGLPGMSGHEVAQQVRRNPELPGLLLVALTGWGGQEDLRKSREAGFDYHLTKPVDVAQVTEIVARVAATGIDRSPATPQ